MKFFLTIPLIALSFCLHAQALKQKRAAKYDARIAKDSVSLKKGGKVYIYQDKSDDIKFLGQLCLGNVEWSQADPIKWSVGLGVDYFFKKYIALHAEYNLALLDYEKLMSNNPNQTNLSENSISRFHSFDFGGRVFLSDKHDRQKHKIIIASRGTMHTQIDYYILPVLPCRKILALRGGVWGYNSVVTTDMNADYNKGIDGSGVVTASDGTNLSKTYFTNAHTTGGYIGISRLTLFSAVTKNSFSKGKIFLSRAVNELYADILFAGTTFDAIIDSNGAHQIVANGPGSFQTSPIGARIGVTRSKENTGRMVSKVELGYCPGLKNKGLYANFGWSIAFVK